MSTILKEAAKMLLKNGYRVIAWQNDSYLPVERKGDYVSIRFGKSGKIGTLKVDKLTGMIEYGFSYIPGLKTGSGCLCFRSSKIDMEEVDRLMNMQIPNWAGNAKFYNSFDDFAKRELSFYDFMFEVIEDVDGGAEGQPVRKD